MAHHVPLGCPSDVTALAFVSPLVYEPPPLPYGLPLSIGLPLWCYCLAFGSPFLDAPHGSYCSFMLPL